MKELEKIKMALLIRDDEPKFESKDIGDYTLKTSIEFTIPKDAYSELSEIEQENIIVAILHDMYTDLLAKHTHEDSLGLWITINGIVFGNSIKLSVLDDMKKYGLDDLDPIYEFFKMAINK